MTAPTNATPTSNAKDKLASPSGEARCFCKIVRQDIRFIAKRRKAFANFPA
jgi:hypothetical protein